MSKVITRRISQTSWRRIIWVAYTKICTFIIPDILLTHLSNGRLKTKERRQAWREKLTLFLTYLTIAAMFCFWLEYITELFCDLPPTYNYEDVYSADSEMSTINGFVVDWEYLGNRTLMSETVNSYPRRDLSELFPKFMLLHREDGHDKYNNRIIDDCVNGFNRSVQASNWLNYKLTKDAGFHYEHDKLISCPLPDQRNETGAPCFYTREQMQEFYRNRRKGTLQVPMNVISNFSTLPFFGYNGTALVVLDNSVLDVTDYLTAATNLVQVTKSMYSRSFALDRLFLPLDLSILLYSHMGRDITKEFYANIADAPIYKACLNELFFRGVIDGNSDKGCARINLALWITLGCFFLYFLIKMNLANLSRLKFMQKVLYKSVPSDNVKPAANVTPISNYRFAQPHVLFFIPCFAESSSIIRQTFDSLARTNFPDTKKLLFFVCDGIVKNKTDPKETYLCVLDALGYSSSNDPETRPYVSLGQGSRKVNYAKVFAGFYESGSNRVPFLMVVKVGSPTEALLTTRIPGNRGKRDSMILVLGFLERCMNLAHNRITPLEFEIFNQCYNLLGIDPREIKYMLTTDADTQVQDDAVMKLVSRMEGDPKLSAISGHIRPANPEENVLTMLQLFPLYMTFFSGLAYEACLGRVTTLNGGFVMYRIWSAFENTRPPLPSNDIEMIVADSSSTKQIDHVDLKKWPKVSDEIVPTQSAHSPSIDTNKAVIINSKVDDSSSDDNSRSTNSNITTTIVSRRKSHRRRRLLKKTTSGSKDQPEPLNLTINPSIQLCCAHPTVLRSFAAMQPDTMHMENILLLGEEQYFSLILLKSLPNYQLAFEPEAFGYVTIPTHFFALQALVIRNLRATFHIQIEFLFAARYLGITYWIVALTKLIDIVLTMPLTIYLYTVFIRYFIYKYLVFGVIALAFTWLVCMYIIYFLLRLQFKFILWLFLYCLFSVPFFNVYFPLLAAWCSDYATHWYDVYPTKSGGFHSRLHGIITDEKAENDTTQEEEADAEDAVMRMRLADFEVVEAEKAARREKEEAEFLDAKFSDFNEYVNTATVNVSGHVNKPSWSSVRTSVTVPPSAQIRDSRISHSRYASEEDAHMLLSPSNRSPTRPLSMSSTHSPHNPFLSALDDPFDDVYSDKHDRTPPLSRAHHRKTSSSRLSNFRRSFINMHLHDNNDSPIQHYRSHSAASAADHPPSSKTPQDQDTYSINDNDSIVSLNPSIISSVFSLEGTTDLANSVDVVEENPENYIPHPHRIISGQQASYRHEISEGRSAPVHSRFSSNQ